MKSFIRLVNKKRAISPVIAVILLIGLAVAAAAAIFLIVLPLFQPSSNLQMDDAYVVYDDEYTTAADLGEGYGKATLVLSNTGTANIDIVSLKVYHANSVLGPWTEITEHEGLLITETNPYTVETLATLEELTTKFLIPEENDNNSVFYKVTIRTSDGDELDTATEANVAETDMQLDKDSPDIDYATISMNPLRREVPIRPSQVSDNSEIKNVTYDVYFEENDSLAHSETIQPPSTLWQWTWNTRNDSSKGLHNGSYYMVMTVNDYAGLSDKTGQITFTIDNDYTIPTINSVTPEASWAEVGDDFKIVANVIDAGCDASAVDEVWLHYKLVNETSYTSVEMDFVSGNDYSDSIPIYAQALEENITFYIEAIDIDDNKEYDYTPILEANDTVYPNIFHTPVPEADEYGDVLINTQVEDPGLVDLSKVLLYSRKSNDLDANATVAGESLPSSWVSINPTTIEKIADTTWNFTWSIPQPYYNVTVHGIDYYINATDRYGGNTAQHGAHHIDIFDLNPPDLVGVSSSDFPDTWTSNTDYPITIQITDNDPTFGRIVNGDLSTFITGEVTIHFKKYDGDPSQTFNPADINQTLHTSGNSSTGEITTWYGTIPAVYFDHNDANHRVDFYLTAEDQSKTFQDQQSVIPTRWPESGFHRVDVKAPGEPNVIYSPYSVGLKNNNETVYFMMNNTASGDLQDAHATLTDMSLEIFSDGWDFTNGEPNLTKVVFTRYTFSDSYNDTGGSPHPWGGNGTWVAFDSDNQGRVEDDNDYNIIELTFSNTSGPSIDMHNMILNVSFKAKVGANPVDDQWIGLIATPGVEPGYDLETDPFLYSGRYYINHWLVTPLYSDNGYTGISWDTDILDPWTLDYSRSDVASGLVKPYHGYNTPNGLKFVISQSNGQWSRIANNEMLNGRSIVNIDNLYSGGASNSYVWFYIVILVDDPGATVSATMWLGSDDEAVCFINHADSYAGFYGNPRAWSESTFSVTLNGQNQNNYILFGVHEVGGGFRGSLAFNVDFDMKVYISAPPPSPAPLQSVAMQNFAPAQRTIEPTILASLEFIQSVQSASIITEFRKFCWFLKK